MLVSRKNPGEVTWRSSRIVSVIVFLSLISCIAIHGENASSDTLVNDKEHFQSTNSTEIIENVSNLVRLPFRRDGSTFGSQGWEVAVKRDRSRSEKVVMRRQMDEPKEQDLNGPCRSFVMDVAVKNEFEFYSPGHAPNHPYPSQMDCVKTIVAPPGHLLRLDFRNDFHLEQSEDCRFDYLEIRDGAHGYSNLIGSYCGNKHPPPITSSDRYLWLRFASDENIQYSGFHAVYWYIPRPTNSGQHPEMDMCQIEVTGNEGFANRSDIDENRIRFSTTYGLPLDCMWIISVDQGWKIMLQFLKFRLEKPNDCDSNFVDVFSDRTDLPSRLKNFCGSIADSVISKSNILHLRFFAEARSINSTFEALFTAFRDKPRDEACDEDEYDCEDATCISIGLRCNGRINCRFRWDEDECQPKLGAFAVILESEHIIIILVVFCLILSGMCFAFLFNCTKKLIRDHRIIQEHLRQSKENVINMESKERSLGVESVAPKIMSISKHSLNHLESSPEEKFIDGNIEVPSRNKESLTNVQGYVSSGDIIPIFDGRKSKEFKNVEIIETEIENAEESGFPEMRDSECQTRESLFSTHLIDLSNSDGSPTPSPVVTLDQTIHSKQKGSCSMKMPPFSTFGYTRPEGSIHVCPGSQRENNYQTFGLAGRYESSRNKEQVGRDEKRYKAEAVIEMENRNRDDSSASSAVRPFSIDSTKSAPDVIVTH